MAFTFSRLTGIRVYTVQPDPVVNPALFEIRADEVDIVRCTGWRSLWLKLRWTLKGFEAFAVALFEQQFKQDASAYAMCFASPRYGQALMVACVSKALLVELKAHARSAGVRLATRRQRRGASVLSVVRFLLQ